MRNTGANQCFLLLTLASVLLYPNCATLTSKPNQKIPGTSQPPGAKIIVDGNEVGYTPLNLRLRRKATHVVRIEQEGYNPAEIRIGPKKSGIGILAAASDVILALAAGMVGDYVHWRAQGKPDQEFGEVIAGFYVGIIAGSIGLVILEGNSNARYTLTPRELSVTLTKTNGTPRVDTMLIDADDFRNVTWIRVRRD